MKTNPPLPRGLTLIELLTVIAIIGILAAILIPVVGTVRAKADNASCLSRIRQTGVAIAAYMVDNKDYLPGPNFSGTRAVPWYAKGSRAEERTLAAWLRPYVSASELTQTGKRFFPEIFQCPSVNKRPDLSKSPAQSEREAITRLLNIDVRPEGDSSPGINPWGDSANVDGPVRPLPYSALSSISLPRTWAMRECALGYANNPGTAAGWVLNKHLPHGEHFNVLYFDWHVGKLPVEQFKD
ncbi:prepilin-type N-terminal cleavage/methylation domain-containing protein [Opitutaceae bacterium TAV1]|nr:prepilin-type N-terminal cleavage/methylation domain-containing protein [Opitutaceae bacterium TAV1]